MNTDKTLRDKFTNNYKYPIWYYKKLREVEIDDVISYLLKENFVVELNGQKIEITFGKNRKHEIGFSQKSDEALTCTSYETINRAFRIGKWFVVTDDDTSEEFKNEYKKEKALKDKEKKRNVYISVLSKAISNLDIKENEKKIYIKGLAKKSDEELQELINILFSNK